VIPALVSMFADRKQIANYGITNRRRPNFYRRDGLPFMLTHMV
jgi:hypothetical protein